jgi:hypothetical protein
MILTQLETVESELQRKRCGQNKVLKLTGLKRRTHGHQERLKRSWDGKDMVETKVQGLNCEISGSLGGFLQDSRDLNIIICETRRSNM